jgi:hypothetical protein
MATNRARTERNQETEDGKTSETVSRTSAILERNQSDAGPYWLRNSPSSILYPDRHGHILRTQRRETDMSLAQYSNALHISEGGWSFEEYIFAAMMVADQEQLEMMRQTFRAQWDEYQGRSHYTGGVLPHAGLAKAKEAKDKGHDAAN